MTETNERLTCCGDVVELLNHESSPGKRCFSLCKTLIRGNTGDNDSEKWSYMLIVEDDCYPIIITEEYAKNILGNPKQGEDLVYNCWMNRYR